MILGTPSDDVEASYIFVVVVAVTVRGASLMTN